MLPALMNCGPRLCIIPMSIAPTNAPLMEPSPPMTTTMNASMIT